MTRKAIYGVNLGGWLVLEKWMTPSLFAGTEAVDEYTLMQISGAAEKIEHHRRSFITEGDFQWLKKHKVEAVRIPVGYWLFESREPYRTGGEYLDWAFDMAEKYNLKVLICLHGAPGSQNGNDHSGKIGRIGWYWWWNRRRTARYLKKITERYAGYSSFWGLEILNEPTVNRPWRGWLLKRWTQKTVAMFASLSGVVYSDAFKPHKWSGVAARGIMDIHHYQCFSPADKAMSVPEHIEKVRQLKEKLEKWSNDQPVIIGEWSGGLAASSLQGVDRSAAEKQFIAEQLRTYRVAAAWFFWSYKTEQHDAWNFRYLVENQQIILK